MATLRVNIAFDIFNGLPIRIEGDEITVLSSSRSFARFRIDDTGPFGSVIVERAGSNLTSLFGRISADRLFDTAGNLLYSFTGVSFPATQDPTYINPFRYISQLDGNDQLFGSTGNDRLSGFSGDDRVTLGAGNDIGIGSFGEDTLSGETGNDILFGGNDDDLIFGGLGFDTLQGEFGDDRLFGDAGNDILVGASGSDELVGGDGNDLLRGGRNDDTLYGGNGADTLQGARDADTAFGNQGRDIIRLGSSDDMARGGGGNDTIFAARGDDTVRGGGGDDVITGGVGDDFLAGGAGADLFIFRGVTDDDVIADFSTADGDRLQIDAFDFDSLVETNRIREENGNTVILLEAGKITLQGVDANSLSADDFILG